MRPALFLFSLLTISIHTISQNAKTHLARVELTKKYGCIDTSGKEVIPAIYDDMGFWGNGLISVNKGAKTVDYQKEGGKWGYCNAQGLLKIPLQFDDAGTFHEGKAAVKINGKWGFIDTSGKLIIKPRFDDVRIFQNGMCTVQKNNKWGYIDSAGNEVIEMQYGEAFEFEDEVARVFVGERPEKEFEESKGAYALINKKGERIIEPIYKTIGYFSEGLAEVEVADTGDSYYTKKGYINKKGELVVPAIYDVAEDFHEGMAVVGYRTKAYDNQAFLEPDYLYGYVTAKGKEVIQPQFTSAYPFHMGRAIVSKSKQLRMYFIEYAENDSILNHEQLPKYALIDKQGNYILDFNWRQLNPIDSNLFIASRAKYNGDGVINSKGETIVPFKYINLKHAGSHFFVDDGGHASGKETTIVDINNQIILKSKQYQMAAPKYEFGLFHVHTKKLNKSGLIHRTGKWVVHNKYDMIWDFDVVE